MSFWKTFGFSTISAIDQILDSGEYTLEQLLDEEEILQETKSQNKKLIDFLIEADSLKTLLSYITQEPDEDADQKRKFKYPFLACEILASEVWALCDAFYQQEGLLQELYSFLDKEPPLNPMLASYTSRVAGVLLQKKVPETIEFLKEKQNIVKSFINHLGNASVMDLLLKVIACGDSADGAGTLEWLCETDLIVSLVEKFDPKYDEEIHENAAQALVDIIAVSMNSTDSPLIAQLESEQVVSKLFGYLLSEGLSSSLLHGLNVIIELLRRHFNEEPVSEESVDKLPPLLKVISQNLEKLFELLKPSPNVKKIHLSAVGEITPLGFHRLKIIEFFAALVLCNFKYIDGILIKLNLLTSCLDLFFKYPWNNFLHTAVGQMIQGILCGQNTDLKMSLIVDSKLLDKIVDASDENDTAKTRPVGIRRGYMGHITLLSETIIEQSHSEPHLKKVLDEHPKWKSYEKGALMATKERENSTIGGFIPSIDDDDYQEDLEGLSEGSDRMRRTFEFNDDEDEEEDDETVVRVASNGTDDEGEFNEVMEVQTETEVWEQKHTNDQQIETNDTNEITTNESKENHDETSNENTSNDTPNDTSKMNDASNDTPNEATNETKMKRDTEESNHLNEIDRNREVEVTH